MTAATVALHRGRSWTDVQGTGLLLRAALRRDRVLLPEVPPGRYYLRVQTELGNDNPRPLQSSLTVRRDVPSATFFLVALGVLAVPVILVAFRQQAFESARWAESDYAPESSDDSDDE